MARSWSKLNSGRQQGAIDFLAKKTGISQKAALDLIQKKGEAFDDNAISSDLWSRMQNEEVKGISGPGSAADEIAGMLNSFYGASAPAAPTPPAPVPVPSRPAPSPVHNSNQNPSGPYGPEQKAVELKQDYVQELDPELTTQVQDEIEVFLESDKFQQEMQEEADRDFDNIILYSSLAALAGVGSGWAINNLDESEEEKEALKQRALEVYPNL